MGQEAGPQEGEEPLADLIGMESGGSGGICLGGLPECRLVAVLASRACHPRLRSGYARGQSEGPRRAGSRLGWRLPVLPPLGPIVVSSRHGGRAGPGMQLDVVGIRVYGLF